jgi:hypothetical protein
VWYSGDNPRQNDNLVEFGIFDMSKQKNTTPTTVDSLLQSLKDAPAIKVEEIIKGMPVIVSMDGKAYTLTPTEENDYTEVIKSYVSQSLQEVKNVLIEQVKEYATQMQKRIDELNDSQSKLYPPPPSLEFVLKNDIQIAVKGSTYYFILPFSYHPKLLNGKKIQHPETLAKEILIFFGYQVNKKGEFILDSVELRNYDFSTFEHYHGRQIGNDCWGHGNFKLPIGTTFSTLELPKLKDRLENFLDNVNGKSIAERYPDKLPPAEYLQVSHENVIWR